MIDLSMQAPGRDACPLADRRRLLHRWAVNTRVRWDRRRHRWRGGGIPMMYEPPVFIGYTCPRWAPALVQRVSWRLYYRWLDRADRRWHRELRRRYRREEGLPPD